MRLTPRTIFSKLRGMRLGLVAALISGSAGIALADARSEAAALFDHGMSELDAHHIESACVAFHDSLARHADIVTESALADCDSRIGKLASAWRLWVDIAKTAPNADLRGAADASAKALEPRLAKAKVKLAAAVPAAVVIEIEGEHLGDLPASSTEAITIAVDPGSVELTARAAGFEPASQTASIGEAATVDVTIPALHAVAVPIPPPPPVHHTTTGLFIAGGGGAVLITGLVFGLEALSRWNDAQSLCGGSPTRCDPDGFAAAQQKLDSAHTQANVSTVLVGLGVAAAAVGVVLYLRSDDHEKQVTAIRLSPMVDGHTVGLSIAGHAW